MATLIRALVYATAFVGFLLVFVPARVLQWSGVSRPTVIGPYQVAGIALTIPGALLMLLCIVSFAHLGKGTPAPFDPPRRLVIRGPYRYVRNPMYIGAFLALGGAALFYNSWFILIYVTIFALILHFFVLTYEEPVLRRTFGAVYDNYCERVRRWLPRSGRAASSHAE